MPDDRDISVLLVREIINTNLTDGQVEGAISTAIVLTENRLQNTSIDRKLMIEIQRWLAAHFCSLTDPSTRVETEKISEASVSYSSIDNANNDGIMSTRWGRTAASLDPTGALTKLYGHSPRLYAL